MAGLIEQLLAQVKPEIDTMFSDVNKKLDEIIATQKEISSRLDTISKKLR